MVRDPSSGGDGGGPVLLGGGVALGDPISTSPPLSPSNLPLGPSLFHSLIHTRSRALSNRSLKSGEVLSDFPMLQKVKDSEDPLARALLRVVPFGCGLVVRRDGS